MVVACCVGGVGVCSAWAAVAWAVVAAAEVAVGGKADTGLARSERMIAPQPHASSSRGAAATHVRRHWRSGGGNGAPAVHAGASAVNGSAAAAVNSAVNGSPATAVNIAASAVNGSAAAAVNSAVNGSPATAVNIGACAVNGADARRRTAAAGAASIHGRIAQSCSTCKSAGGGCKGSRRAVL